MALRGLSGAFSKLQEKIRNLQNRLSRYEDEEVPPRKASLPVPDKLPERMIVEISTWSATKVIFLVFIAYLLFSFLERITSILILLFVSLFLATTLTPGVDWLQRRRIPRGFGTILLMLVVVSVFLGIIGGMIPVIAGEVAKMWQGLTDFAVNLSQEDFSGLPQWLQESLEEVIPPLREYISGVSPEELQNTIANFAKNNLANYAAQFGNVAGKGVAIIANIFGGIFQTILVLILTFFLVVEKGNISRFFVRLFPKKYESYLQEKGTEIKEKIAEWVHGQIILFFIIGGIAYVGLSIIGIDYALTLALIAGLSEFIPYVGPFFAFASAAPVAFNESFSTGIITMLFYIGIQMVDGNIIIPLIMRRTVGVSPVVTIIAMLIGWEFLGIMGMILAVPVASVLSLFVEDYSPRDRRLRIRPHDKT